MGFDVLLPKPGECVGLLGRGFGIYDCGFGSGFWSYGNGGQWQGVSGNTCGNFTHFRPKPDPTHFGTFEPSFEGEQNQVND